MEIGQVHQCYYKNNPNNVTAGSFLDLSSQYYCLYKLDIGCFLNYSMDFRDSAMLILFSRGFMHWVIRILKTMVMTTAIT